MQTGKVKQVRENIKSYPNKRDTTGKNPMVYVHGITIEGDPIEWEYHSLAQTCTKFVPTQEATFITETKQNGNFTNHKISPVEAKPVTGFGGGFKKPTGSYSDQGRIAAMSVMSTAVDFYRERSTGLDGSPLKKEHVFALAEEIFAWVYTKSSEK